MTYYAGDPIRHTCTFATNTGTATDPGTVTFTFISPSLVESVYVYGDDVEVVKSSTGVYYCDQDTALADVGVWESTCVGTDPLPKTDSQMWTVAPPL